jgi:hypothetical protein
MPDDMLAPGPGNPKGYFEDSRMHFLHRAMLEAHQTGWGLAPRLRKLRNQDLRIPDELKPEAEELAAMYREHEPWVWKNPRATLFLEEWARWFPEATFVICVRRPDAVVDSMLRRGDRLRIHGNRPDRRIKRLNRATSVWFTYNLLALRFAQRHPDKTVIVRIPEDLPQLDAATGRRLFDPKMLRKPRAKIRRPLLFAVRAKLLYRRLSKRADVDAVERLLEDSGSARVSPLVRIAATTTAGLLLNVGASITC